MHVDRRALVAPFVLVVLAASPAAAQKQNKKAAPAATSLTDSTRPPVDRALQGLRWRNIGPWRGGRAVAVTGDPVNKQVFYMGSVNGGVWKTSNGGISWQNITDGKNNTISSVGAIAVAPSDPNVIWVGGGEGDWREDLTYGDGIWRSTDGGETWDHLGLEDARHISVIRVDPQNPDVAYVAALGHAFGPNETRGVFRTRDGGKSWQKILYIDENTGAADIALDPNNTRIVYAAMWRARRTPWSLDAGGGHSGLWKSIDGGESWTELTRNPGMPKDPVGRIGITVSPARSNRLYAVVETPPEDSSAGIYRSDDAGRTWEMVNGDQKWQVRPWYYSGIFADPADPNTVYALNLSTWRSVDGGKSWTRLQVPHGDDHILWIDPKDPRRMIEGNDGGATISFDEGQTWSSIYNQPTAQFYHVITDNQFPYRVYGAQQDNTPVSIASASDAGAIGTRDWWPIGGGEAGYVAVDPLNPDVTYVGDYMGTIIRGDHRTEQRRDVSVWQNNWDGHAAKDAPYRFQWTFPIVYSPHDPHKLYATAQKVFVTTNDGQSWQAISPDLTLHDPATIGPSGGPITRDMTGTEWYATIFAFAESPVQAGVLWAGSDDGLVHVSRDGGAHWENVTPRGLGKFTRMSILEPSHFDAGTVYLAANRYQQDDFRPYLFKSTDYGKTWTPITTGIPTGAYTRAIREDPRRRGLLYAGTETGAYVSFDDGAHWQSLQLNLPRTSVRDLAIHGSDLIVATHGRSFWVLDDVTPLRQHADSVRQLAVHVFTPQPAVRWGGGSSREQSAGPNPPNGLVLDYWLREKPKGPVTLAFLDGSGKTIRTFTSEEKKSDSAAKPATPPAGRDSVRAPGRDSTARDTAALKGVKLRLEQGRDTASFVPGDSVVPARTGANRFVWNLRYPGVHALKDVLVDEGILEGPLVVPGNYTAKLTVDGKSYTQPFTVVMDPRVKTSAQDLQAQLALLMQIHDQIDTVTYTVERIGRMIDQIGDRQAQVKGQSYASRVEQPAKALKPKLDSVRNALAEVEMHAYEISLHYPVRIYNQLLTLNAMTQSADAAPTQAELDSYKDLAAQVDRQLRRLADLERTDVAAFNQTMKQLDVPAVMTAGQKADLVP